MTTELHPSTAENVEQQQAAAKAALEAATAWLKETFPKTFAEGRDIVPLKIDIATDLKNYLIKHPDVPHTNTKLRKALACYTRQRHYIRILRTGSPRIDLLGEECGEVTEQESDSAHKKLKRRTKGFKPRGNNARFMRRRPGGDHNTQIKVKRKFSKPLNPNFSKISLNKKPERVTG